VATEKDRLATEVEERWIDFQMARSDKRRYPMERFRGFWHTGKRYSEMGRATPSFTCMFPRLTAALNMRPANTAQQ